MQVSDLEARIYRRLGEDPANPEWWTPPEVLAALNWAQRLFVLLTLCLEQTSPWQLDPGVQVYHMLARSQFFDWIAPLRFRLQNDPSALGGTSEPNTTEPGLLTPNAGPLHPPQITLTPKLRPSRLADFDAQSDTWQTDVRTPDRYALLKADLLVLNRSTTLEGTALNVTYARAPLPLVLPGDIPEIPTVDHQALSDLATVILRMKDGGQELAKSQRYLEGFIDAAKRRAAQVRARSVALQYDTVPFEIERFDWSRLLKRRQDLPPTKQREPWPTSA